MKCRYRSHQYKPGCPSFTTCSTDCSSSPAKNTGRRLTIQNSSSFLADSQFNLPASLLAAASVMSSELVVHAYVTCVFSFRQESTVAANDAEENDAWNKAVLCLVQEGRLHVNIMASDLEIKSQFRVRRLSNCVSMWKPTNDQSSPASS